MLSVLITWIRTHLPQSERGQDLIEYALLGGLIAAAIIAVIALGTMTDAITSLADGVGDCIDFDNSVGSECSPV